MKSWPVEMTGRLEALRQDRRAAPGCPAPRGGSPNRRTLPAEGATSIRIDLSSVVLPAPFSPISPTVSPWRTVSSMS